ncbi:MAG TPA: glycosyltransferase family 39 protein [Candidatus Binatia bacterium]|nr:glycosyltransferase family 39 protein [Candidatus Binatia bacterium]
MKPLSISELRKAIALLASLALIVLFLAQGIYFIHANAPTYDEAMHLAAGYSYLATRDFRLEPQNPPLIKTILALPLFLRHRLPFRTDTQAWSEGDGYPIGQNLLFQSALPADQMMLLARLPNLLIGLLVVLLAGWWACRLWGGGAAVVAIALASLDPNLVAHSSLVTTDAGATLFIFTTIYLLWEYLRSRSCWYLAFAALSLGLALVSKFSTVLLVPIIGSILASSVIFDDADRNQLRRRRFSAGWLQAIAAFSLMLLVAAPLIPAAYFFQSFQLWLTGFGKFMTLAREGQLAFFLGQVSYEGFWAYYPVAFLIKTPIGSLLLMAASVIFYRAGNPLRRSQTICLLLPVVIVFLALTQSKVNIGVRHILPVYPFFFVIASRRATANSSQRWILMVGAALLFTGVSALRIAPHQLAYFNEFVGGPGAGYRYLSDSNLDWGQDLKGLKAYLEKERVPIIYLSYFGTAPPSYYGIRYQYVPGAWPLEWPPPDDKVPADAPRKILAISASNLHDADRPDDPLFDWLQTRRPSEKIGYSIFIYDLTDDREGLMKLEETYIKAGVILPF